MTSPLSGCYLRRGGGKRLDACLVYPHVLLDRDDWLPIAGWAMHSWDVEWHRRENIDLLPRVLFRV